MDGQMDGRAVRFRDRDQDFRIRRYARGNVDDIRTEIPRLRAVNGVNDEYHRQRGWGDGR